MKEVPEKKTSIVEVGFGISKTVQKKRFEPVKRFMNIVVANPTDISLVGQAMFALGDQIVDEAFKAIGLDPNKDVTEHKHTVTEPGMGKKGVALERRQERRPSLVEAKSPTEKSLENQSLIQTARTAIIRLEDNGTVVKSVAHAKYLRSQKLISYEELMAIEDAAKAIGLPDKLTRKSGPVDVKKLKEEKKIRSIKHAGFLRYNKEISYEEYQAILANANELFIVTA